MSSTNKPDKLTLDAYADPQLQTQNGNGVYNRFSNTLRTPILNAKGIQLTDAAFVNSLLQLNDNSQLFFWYYVNSVSIGNLRLVRLLPSSYVAPAGYTAFTRNRYFNSVVELVAALNQAASTGGDDISRNGLWAANQVVFSYDTNTRRISVDSTTGTPITPAAADDPNVLTYNAPAVNSPTMNTLAGFVRQPRVAGFSMNARLGFAMSYNTRPLNVTAPVLGAANSTGNFQSTPIEADASPILLASQNVRVYMSIVGGSGMDVISQRKNLIATIPIGVAPLNVQVYSTPLEKPAMSVPNEIYDIQVELLDDYGQPFMQPPSYNTTFTFAVYY